MSVQVTYRQGFAAAQPATDNAMPALQSDDAQGYYGRGSALKDLKRFPEALAAFDRAIALKPDYAEAHNSRGIVLANLNRSDDALAAFDRAAALKPDYAEAYNNRAIVLEEQKRFADALASYDKALGLTPDNARMHNNHGNVLRQLKQIDAALASYGKAITLKPDYAEAYYNRGIALQELKRFKEALADYTNAIALKSDYGDAYNNRGTILHDLKRPGEAISDYDKALALAPNSAEIYSNKAYSLLQMGHMEEGWRLHEWRKLTELPVGNRSFPRPLWLGRENVAGKIVFVHWEQGFGDTIQFCRYGRLIAAKGAKVVMSVQEPLRRLLQQQNLDVDIIGHNEVPAAFDFHCPMMSLPLAFGTTPQTIPAENRYIAADPHLVGSWRARLPLQAKPRIGIVWSGSTKHKNDLNRSLRLPALAPLFSVDAQFVALQKELRDGEAVLLRGLDNITPCGDQLSDFADTAAVIALLDLVIAVDTSVAHLAGAMGKPVWILLPFNADWRWLLDRDDSPWYPSARLFRQAGAQSWTDVIERVHAALSEFIRSRS